MSEQPTSKSVRRIFARTLAIEVEATEHYNLFVNQMGCTIIRGHDETTEDLGETVANWTPSNPT